MSQRSFGRPLAGDPDHAARTLALGLLVVPAALLLAQVFDPDAFTVERVATVLAIQAAGTAIFAGLESWDLFRAMRRAEPADSVSAPSAPEELPRDGRLVPAAFACFVLVLGAAFVFGDAYTLVAGAAALLMGEELGPLAARSIARRRERRLGRRYYTSVGEPEKVVWLGASGLE